MNLFDITAPTACLPVGLQQASLLARASGHSHDLGKFGDMFQGKLHRACIPSKTGAPVIEGDLIRHEWLSLHVLLLSLRQGKVCPDALVSEWDKNWGQSLRTFDHLNKAVNLSKGMASATSALLFLVFTHHKLPKDQNSGPKAPRNGLGAAVYVDDAGKSKIVMPVAQPNSQTWSVIKEGFDRLSALPEASTLHWRAVATVARMALILSDHSISSVDKRLDPHWGSNRSQDPKVAFANTRDNGVGKKVMNQHVDWHLLEVGNLAEKMVQCMWSFDPPALSKAAVQRLRQPAEGRFAWQSVCADALRASQETQKLPTLVFNVAGTGAGKTRMNVVALDALRRDEPLRFASCFNLRTLTTQTHEAYALQLGIGSDEMALVMGRGGPTALVNAATAHSTPVSTAEDEDGNDPEEDFEVKGECDPAPPWLAHFLEKTPALTPIVMMPVVVATIDHLVKAGDPNEKANHALTMLRMMRSDLVIDEVDSFDPKALACVAKLVTSAAMWGRHVVVSSATLAEPVASALYKAYDLGIKMGASLGVLPSAAWRQAVIDDQRGCSVCVNGSVKDFGIWFRNEIELLMKVLSANASKKRPAELIAVTAAPKGGIWPHFSGVVATACKKMHERHAHEIVVDGHVHKISFGLVRVANVNVAVPMASALCKLLPSARVACYHAQLNRLQRQKLEQALDVILVRKMTQDEWEQKLLATPEAIDAMRRSRAEGRDETSFVVVATPVEEIGRDHDFDWAVIEPSSTQSIVQVGGRVNRHRLLDMLEPNIGILQFNYLHLRNVQHRRSHDPCFLRPGLEIEDNDSASGTSHPLRDMTALVNWPALHAAGQLDARLRYDDATHPFAKFDNEASQKEIKKWLKAFLNSDSCLWMGANTYHPLRDGAPTERWTVDEQGVHRREERLSDAGRERGFRVRVIDDEPGSANAWLTWTVQELVGEAVDAGENPQTAMVVELRALGEKEDRVYVRNDSFGYWKP